MKSDGGEDDGIMNDASGRPAVPAETGPGTRGSAGSQRAASVAESLGTHQEESAVNEPDEDFAALFEASFKRSD